MNTFLVPVDFSPASRSASLYAASLAKAAGARLLLFHSYMIPTPVSEVPYVLISVDDLQVENEKLARKEAETLHTNFDIEVETLVQIGMPSDEIAATAAGRKVSLVIIGMRGAGTLDKLIGSTTAAVVRKASTPVMVVPDKTIFSPIRQVAYASDLSYNSTKDLFQPLLSLVQLFSARVHIIHITKTGNPVPAERGKGMSKTDVLNLFAAVDHDFTIVTDDSVKNGIQDYIANNEIQLLVMVAHKHSFFDRIFSKIHTTDMAYETKIPLLVLHES